MIKHSEVIKTGNDTVDGVLTVLLSTTILVGGFTGCLLDNIIPGINTRINMQIFKTKLSVKWNNLKKIMINM